MKNVNKYVKALSAIWLIISFIIASSEVADSYAEGMRCIFAFLGCFASVSFPVWLYFIGFYLWGDGYVKRVSTKVIYSPFRVTKSLIRWVKNSYQEAQSSSYSE